MGGTTVTLGNRYETEAAINTKNRFKRSKCTSPPSDVLILSSGNITAGNCQLEGEPSRCSGKGAIWALALDDADVWVFLIQEGLMGRGGRARANPFSWIPGSLVGRVAQPLRVCLITKYTLRYDHGI